MARGPSPTLAPEVYELPLSRAGVERVYQQKTEPWWSMILPNLLPIIIFIGLWFFLLNQMQNSGNKAISFGKNRARLYTAEGKTKVTFDDVAGADEAKEELGDCGFSKTTAAFYRTRGEDPQRCSAGGTTGAGKPCFRRRWLVKLAYRSLVSVVPIFVEMFVGVGASRVRIS